ncbi:hypothetical protein F401_gp19 [Aeromonas phage phiAS7]|uniref:Uncharacterized protein n=1 Tax=Aeromonas phage phiAS7 TaxID=1141132 RepID=H6UK26_9CAUD|nr:hypothetical protein F401_gp19 [Aeromonas phage phiAS7]AEZ65044.1 hypothetical protein phiAS7_00019 [Aeromonas phage phiAS7]
MTTVTKSTTTQASTPAAKAVAKAKAIVTSLKPLFADEAAMDKAIEAVAKKSNTLQADVQRVAVGIMAHAYHHGDYSRAATLINALGEGIRKKALIEWFHLAGLTIDEENGGFKGWQGKGFIEKHWARITEKKWWECKPENVWQGFDLNAELARLIKKAEQANKKADKLRQEGKELPEDAVKIDAAALTALRGLVREA